MNGEKTRLKIVTIALLVAALSFIGLACRSVPTTPTAPEKEDIPPEIAQLLPRLHDENPNVREKALWDLNRVHQRPDLVVREATRLLTDEFDTTRGAAATVLSLVALYNREYPEAIDQTAIQPAFDVAIPLLIALSENENEKRHVRSSALTALSLIGHGQSKETILPILIANLANEDESMRRAACLGLESIRAPVATAIPLLTERLRDDAPAIRAAALDALGKYRKDASSAWPEMVKMIDDPSAEVRFSLIGALLEFGNSRPEDYKKILTVLAEDDDPYVRELATEILAFLDD